MKPQQYDPLFEAILRQAIRDNIYEEAESIPGDDILATILTISTKHDTRMRRLCAREDRLEQVRSVMRPAKKIAVAAMLVITILSSALMVNTTVRAAVAEVVTEWYEQFTRFVGIKSEELVKSQDWSPEFLPEGYVQVDIFEGSPTIIEYEDENANLIIFRYNLAGEDLFVDNEETKYFTTEIAGITFYIFASDHGNKSNTIIWFKNGYRFNIDAYLDVDVLLEIAKSVNN